MSRLAANGLPDMTFGTGGETSIVHPATPDLEMLGMVAGANGDLYVMTGQGGSQPGSPPPLVPSVVYVAKLSASGRRVAPYGATSGFAEISLPPGVTFLGGLGSSADLATAAAPYPDGSLAIRIGCKSLFTL